ncbi:MAG: glycosyltransferase family 39 protein, partial [Chthoniobacterales bacterium]|nr:glycosyltransferase family 39 protein [Chthoniobacterales bacterium]
PLLTYLNQFLVITPLRFVMGNIFSLKQETQRPVILIFSRLLTVSMFAGSVWLVFLLLKQAGVGEGTASAAALLMGTSSGMLIFNRFLTADSPLLFWMLLAFYFSISAAQEKSKGKAILAGLCIGLATAMKYNGLFVCAALPAAVLATMGWKGILWRGFWLGVVASPLGFAMGNPGFVFDFPRFYQDFLYNLYVTPVYEGQTNSHSYAKFWTFLPEIIGWGGVFLLTIGLVCLILFFSSWLRLSSSRVLVVAAAAVFLLYYWKIGGFPRAATRFVLPSVPFLLLLGAIGWGSVSKYLRKIGVAAFVIVLGYNSLASLEAGFRFLHDPRMPALDWMRTNVGEGEVVENSYAPNWSKLAGFRGKVIMMPTVTGRASLFPGILPTNPVLERGIRVHETPPEAVAYFSEEALRSRNPTWIAFTSQVFDFSGNETVQRYY